VDERRVKRLKREENGKGGRSRIGGIQTLLIFPQNVRSLDRKK
jgi:hypothetical protein